MKTLKKVLSLVLVVAMIASMLIVGAAAADEKTNYEEAVAVVTGLGIIEGDENGYNFAGNVTREQAAKIISYLLLGKTTAESLKTGTAPFADVAASRWSAGYIAYLKNQGIISGVTDTEFDPTAPVSGIAFAKMLLVAAGYGANGEFDGRGWDINTITYANENGIFEGTLAADLEAGATREEAMLYAFNLLTKVPVVKYNKTFESYYTGTSALAPVTGAVDPANPTVTDENGVTTVMPYAYTLGYSKYDLVLDTSAETNDIFGRPCASWTKDGVAIAENVATATPNVTAIGSVDSAAIYDAFGKTVVENLNTDLANKVTVYTDGTASNGAYWAPIAKGEHTNGIYAATVELYLQNLGAGEFALIIVATNDHIGTVKRVNTANNYLIVEEETITYPAPTYTATRQVVTHTFDGEEIDITGISRYDVVVFSYGSDRASSPAKVYNSIVKVEPVLGLYTGDYSMWKVIDGGYYMGATSADYTTLSMAYDNTYELYFDRNGSIMKADLYAGNASFDYLYVTGAEAQAYNGSVLNGGDAKVALKVVYPNGGTAVLYAAVNYSYTGYYYYITVEGVDYQIGDGCLYAADDALCETPIALEDVLCGWKSHTVNEAGAVTLKAISPNYANVTGAIEVVENLGTDIVVGGVTYSANSKTVLTKVDAFGTAVTYTGVKNFPDATLGAAGTVLYTYDLGSTAIKNIVVYTGMVLNSTTLNLAYCAQNLGTATAGTTYMFYVDGAPVIATVDANLSTGCVYNLTNTFGVYTATPANTLPGVTMVNEGSTYNRSGDYTTDAPATPYTYYGYMNYITYATHYFEWATVASVDENWFYTVAVADDIDSIEASVAKQQVDAVKYFYDENTIIYDCTNNGAIVEGIDAGDVFVAATSATASNTYADANYCTYIWIVG